jgi:DNA-binding MarR family transcriptional regulator
MYTTIEPLAGEVGTRAGASAESEPEGENDDRRPELAAELQVAVMRLARRLRAESPNDSLTPSQLGALATLGRLGPQAVGDLAKQERVRAPSMTRTAARLADEGLVTRSKDQRDARVVIVELTDLGRERLTEHRSRRRAWLNDRLGELSREDRELLADACRVLGRLVVE